MIDYEWLILDRQESDEDDCTGCPHRHDCLSQCEQIRYGRPLEEIYPHLFQQRR